jgi:AraC-like DNA-binding protein
MLQTILLLTPIYIGLFWSIALTANKRKDSIPQLFLSKFMFFGAIAFTTIYLYFKPISTIYPFFDCAFQYAISFMFPVYYIYFRLLTIDVKFTLKAHARYLILPFLLASTYLVGVLCTSWMDYTGWLADNKAFADSAYLQFLSVMRIVILIHFLLQFLFTLIGNQLLIRKYGVKAEQYYSDMEEENYNNAKILNYCIAIICVVSLVIVAIDHQFSLPKETLLYTVLSISSIMLYVIGYLGIKQKPINPTFEVTNNGDVLLEMEVIPVDSRKKILHKVLVQFEEEKIFLNSQLNIMDIVQAVGTNRTYISSIINQQFNQNFCSFVNSYRIVELRRILLKNPDYTNEVLADSCGFGSLNSLKRALVARTGLTLPEWKKQVLSTKGNDM